MSDVSPTVPGDETDEPKGPPTDPSVPGNFAPHVGQVSYSPDVDPNLPQPGDPSVKAPASEPGTPSTGGTDDLQPPDGSVNDLLDWVAAGDEDGTYERRVELALAAEQDRGDGARKGVINALTPGT